MKKKIAWEPGQSILFVCFGNTCRSPMAEGLAKKRLEQKLGIKSSGISPTFEAAQPEAIEVMQELFEVDISDHKPQLVSNIGVEDFDWIIALDAYVYNTLQARYPKLREKIFLWDIDDPFGRSKKFYVKTAKLIDYCFTKFLIH